MLMNLRQFACEIARRLSLLFELNNYLTRPSLQPYFRYKDTPKWCKPFLFEYFGRGYGAGVSASHQIGCGACR